MAAKEILDQAEKALDAIEERLDAIEDAEEVYEQTKSFVLPIALGAVVAGLAVGAVTGYFLAKKRLEKKFEEELEEEKARIQTFYSKVNKEEYPTATDAAEKLLPEKVEVVEEAAVALTSYKGEVQDTEHEPEVVLEPRRNIFTEAAATEELPQDEIDSRSEDKPYILTEEEYMAGEKDYQQVSLTYFDEDDVLVDEQEKPIIDINKTVGDDNLTKFGYGSRDNKLVYIRNDELSLDFEVVKSERSYKRDILGFLEHSDRQTPRRFRGGDE